MLFLPSRVAKFARIFLIIKMFIFLLFIFRSRFSSSEEETLEKGEKILKNPTYTGKLFWSEELRQTGFYQSDQFQMQNFDDEVFVYSAFVDLRNGNIGYPKIRVFAIMKNEIGFLCHFSNNYSTSTTSYLTAENHGMPFKVYILSCTIPDELARPFKLSKFLLERKTTGTIKEILINNVIMDNLKFNYEREFTICVPTLFGKNYSPTYIKEFIETSTLLGANYFYFYIHPDSYTNYAPILNFFKGQGRLTYVNFSIPPPATEQTWNYGQLLVANDCVYRNAGRSKFVVLNDVDEFLVPYAADNWHDSFARGALWKDATNAAYAIQTFYFSVEKWTEEIRITESAAMGTSNADQRFTKCIVRPEKIFEQGIHHVSRVIQDYYKFERLNVDFGALHHYKLSSSTRLGQNGPLIEKRRLIELIRKADA